MSSPWSKAEVEQILASYFQMLHLEISGQSYNKTAFRKALLPYLNQRSGSSVEFKHRNISAILLKYGLPSIIGYKPLANYQGLLEEMVLDYLIEHKDLDLLFEQFSAQPLIASADKIAFEKLLVEPPSGSVLQEPNPSYAGRLRKPNYLAIEQRNRLLGESGEELIVKFEQWRLIQQGKEKLAERVEWVSQEAGDGAGFDILSRNENGTDRYIEVKTTTLGNLTPFYFSRNELAFSQQNAQQFYLYRLFQFSQQPGLFIKNGSFDDICRMEPTHFIGRV